MESFGQPNAVATTAAGNPVLAFRPDEARYTFQVAQTRAGLWVNEQGPLRGQLEVDFVDFARSTPTVASLPRLRIARVEWALTQRHVLSLGQDWDLHAPVNPHGLNLVGALFQAGNAGFMRQQLKYFYRREGLELAAAVGFAFNNNSARMGVAEVATAPTLAVRGAWTSGKSRAGVSALTTAVPFALGTEAERYGRALSVVLFAELHPRAGTQLRLELNAGQNGANLGLLTLAQGSVARDVREAGGFVSVRHALGTHQALLAMAGTQRVLGEAPPLPSYGYPPGTELLPDPSTAALAGGGPGIRYNSAARLGYEYKPTDNTSVLLEGFFYQTRHVLLAVDLPRGLSPVRRALGLETGLVLTF